jgi:hypothetical protein
MTMSRVVYLGTAVLLAQVLLTQGCGSNNPSNPPEGTGGTTPIGGTTTPDTTSVGVGGTTTPATTGTGGAGGGATGTTSFTPLCGDLKTAGGSVPSKGVTCVDGDPSPCYKTCGPESKGFKSETCTGGSYVEQSGCDFPPGNYACYKIPVANDPTCPTDATPQATKECSVAQCVPCNLNGNYLDSGGASKEGFCVCQAPGATGVSKWSCASKTAWPCPNGEGC